MLPPDARVVLVTQLTPEDGWQLDHAVATTFTLGLEAALVAPLAFAAHRLRDSSDPLAVMEAVRGCADRVDVFCQAGNIAVPATVSDLFAFLEPMIHQVRQPGGRWLFHPKLWLARYTGPAGELAYRLLVLSRNLTADQSWDVCLRLDGVPATRPHGANRPLADLLRWLVDGNCVGELAEVRSARVRALAEEVRRVDWVLPEDVRDLKFHAFGIGHRSTVDFGGTRHLVVSPFVNSAGLRRVAPVGSRSVRVVSRQEELDRLPREDTDRVEAHVLNNLAGLSEDNENNDSDILAGLHAKLYVVEYDHTARVLVGSANATDAAFGGNVEILVELEGTKHRLGIASMMDPDAPFAGLLEPYGRLDDVAPADDEQWRLDDLLRRIAGTPFVVTVGSDTAGYRLELSSARLADWTDIRVTVEVVTRRGEARELAPGAPAHATFAGLTLTQVSPFLLVHAEDRAGRRRGTVIQASLVGDPADRLDEILAKQIDSPEKFLRFLALLLGFTAGTAAPAGIGLGVAGGWRSGATGVFELLVRALVDQPKALADLGRLVERMRRTEAGRSLLPDGFDDLWSQIEAAGALLYAQEVR